jgi:23S rRNA pseudouridine1911/1915/1917 synthase
MFHAENLSSINGVIRPGIVHRIDKDTSGILMIAKDNKAHNSLAHQLKEKTTKRVYVAVVHGRLKEEEGHINAPIARNPKDRLKMAVVKGGKEAVTHYKVIKAYKNYSIVELRLETGRTHQIRVHMAYIGHPLLGDPVYGKKNEKIKHNGQLLHAKLLGFNHPRTGEYMEFDSQLPEYFVEIIHKIEAVERG